MGLGVYQRARLLSPASNAVVIVCHHLVYYLSCSANSGRIGHPFNLLNPAPAPILWLSVFDVYTTTLVNPMGK